MSLQQTDQEAAAVATAPRVALADIEAKVAHQYFVTGEEAVSRVDAPDGIAEGLDVLTICFVVMTNGFIVIGKSAPVSPENFNAELGRKFAHEDAIRQLWPMEGYLLRETVSQIVIG